MSLTKLFNFKYLRQNIKITKGQLCLFLCIIPVFTFLTLALATNDYYTDVKDLIEISIINILGMFVVPLILSISLFSYVYKKESVDLINSMPIKRKTIFLTNTLIGIVLIIIMQLANMIGLFILQSINSDMIIFKEAIFDTFIMMTISYIFVFTATNIAMSLSGNILTQIVVSMLILFFIPFSVGMINSRFYSRNLNYDLLENGEVIGFLDVRNDAEETMPFRIIRLALTNQTEYIFNLNSICKMIFLSIVYILVGLYTFDKRKFENSHESFSNTKIHFIVKTLTIFPMIMILTAFHYLEYDIELIIFCLALVVVYYFLYDLVTSKKIKFKTSIINLVIILLFLNGICFGITEMIENNQFRNINKEDILGVAINISANYKKGFENSKVLDYYINDKDFIDLIYNPYSDLEENISYGYDRTLSASSVRIKLKNGRTFNTYLSIYNGRESQEEINEKIIKKLENDENYIKLYKEQFKERGILLVRDRNISKENDEICKLIDEYIDKCSLRQLMSLTGSDLARYAYKNHHIISYRMNADITDEIFKKIVEFSNNQVKEIINDKEINYYNIEYRNKFNFGEKYYSYKDEENKEIIRKVILEEDKNPLDFKDEYYMIGIDFIDSNNRISQTVFYTDNDKIKEIYAETAKSYEEHDDIYKEKNDYIVVDNTVVPENAVN